jgi:hypothetical protein
MKGSSNISNSTSEIKEHERILNIFNEGTASSFSVREDPSKERFIANKPPLTERAMTTT